MFCGKCGNQISDGQGCDCQAPLPVQSTTATQVPPSPARLTLFGIRELAVLICGALMLVWLALPFVTSYVEVPTWNGGSWSDGWYDDWDLPVTGGGGGRARFEQVRTSISGYEFIFGNTARIDVGDTQTAVRTPGLWSAAVMLFVPILILIAIVIFVKKGKNKAMMAIALFGAYRSAPIFFGVLDANALLSRTAVGSTWNGGRMQWEYLSGQVDAGISVGIGNVLFFITWLAVLSLVFFSMKAKRSVFCASCGGQNSATYNMCVKCGSVLVK